MNNVYLFIIAFVICGIVVVTYLVCKNNPPKKKNYRYVVFYQGGRKATYEYELTEAENKQLNDTLNKNPNVSSYDVFENEK